MVRRLLVVRIAKTASTGTTPGSIAPPPPPPPPPEEEPPALAALTVGVILLLVTLPELLVSVTVNVQDSADNSSFADVAVLATLVATGAGGAGSAAVSLTQRVPLTLRRYVRVNIAASATAGDSTAKKGTLALAF